ncbi:MAG: HAMP domain-containing sensor histidine kinase [Acidimicrobiia bacterium]
MTDARSPFALRAYVAGLGLLAAAAVVFAVLSVTPGLESVLGLAVGVLAVWIVQGQMRLRRFRGERSEMYSYEEALFPVLLVTIGPALSVLSFAIGTVYVNLVEHKRGVKLAFNVSQFTLATAVGGAAAGLVGIAADGRGIIAVLVGSALFAALAILIFGTLMSLLGAGGWREVTGKEVRQTGSVVGAEVLLGTTAGIGILAVPALAPVAVLTLAVVLQVHRRWFEVARDREQIDDLLHATVDLHSSLTTDEVGRRLSAALYTLISAEAHLVSGGAEPPTDGMVFEVDTGSAGPRRLVVRRDTRLEPTAIAICETLARVAGVSYRMAGLLEEHEVQAEDLRAVIAEREAFLSATAHQLRTPLTAMVGFSSLLWQQPDDPQVIKEMMSHLVGQAGEMTHHLDNLLVSSRALTDSVMISRDDVDLRAEAERAVAALPPGGPLVSVIGESARTMIDAVRLRHILRNLLANAKNHGGSSIEVHTGIDQDRVWIEVRDDGPGLSPAVESKAFESARSQGVVSADPEGVGLGLHVARLLARLMGGEVTYRRADGWTVFRVEFPGRESADG